jgi:glycosyltransferase involved in cell wall biosynthesis
MIHQLLHTLNYGDAISGEALALQRVIRSQGVKSEIYCINTHPYYQGQTLDYRTFDHAFLGEVILHYSLGSPLNKLYRELTLATRTLIYHNITPSHWFEGVNPRIVKDIESGISELPELLKCSQKLLADSEFNASEIHKLGFKCDVLPLTVDPSRWQQESNAGFAELVRKEKGINILHVGRLAPNKCIEDILKVFYFLHHHIDKNSRLWLVGIDIDTELYSFSLKRMVEEFGLTGRVEFCGGRSDDELKALYQNCSVYLAMSEHEGFCVPVIEAMHYGLPVVSYDAAALKETVGSGGVLLHKKDPLKTAELINQICKNENLRSQLVAAGKQRALEFSFDKFEANVDRYF